MAQAGVGSSLRAGRTSVTAIEADPQLDLLSFVTACAATRRVTAQLIAFRFSYRRGSRTLARAREGGGRARTT
jgi:hypothetical protein